MLHNLYEGETWVALYAMSEVQLGFSSVTSVDIVFIIFRMVSESPTYFATYQ